jgi:acyl-coenzyme A synthetase/AMP-(fatty) acid ligase
VVPSKTIQNEQICIDRIKDYIADKIGRFAVPEKIIITDQLPRTPTGKLFRSVLRRIASGEEALD